MRILLRCTLSQSEGVFPTSAECLSFLLVFPSISLYWCFSPHRLAFSLQSVFVFLSILIACHVAFSLCPFSLSFPPSLLWLCPSFVVIKCSSCGRWWPDRLAPTEEARFLTLVSFKQLHKHFLHLPFMLFSGLKFIHKSLYGDQITW